MYGIHLIYIQNFRTLSSLGSSADWVESYLVENLEDRFSPIAVITSLKLNSFVLIKSASNDLLDHRESYIHYN